MDGAVGRIAYLKGLPREGLDCGRKPSFHCEARAFFAENALSEV
jgi:hypothetical protein